MKTHRLLISLLYRVMAMKVTDHWISTHSMSSALHYKAEKFWK